MKKQTNKNPQTNKQTTLQILAARNIQWSGRDTSMSITVQDVVRIVGRLKKRGNVFLYSNPHGERHQDMKLSNDSWKTDPAGEPMLWMQSGCWCWISRWLETNQNKERREFWRRAVSGTSKCQVDTSPGDGELSGVHMQTQFHMLWTSLPRSWYFMSSPTADLFTLVLENDLDIQIPGYHLATCCWVLMPMEEEKLPPERDWGSSKQRGSHFYPEPKLENKKDRCLVAGVSS